VGKTDSELAFCFLLGKFLESSAKALTDIEGSELLAWMEELDELGSADFVVSDGRSLAEIVPESDPTSPEDEAARLEFGARVDASLAEFEAMLRDDRERLIWTRRLRSNDPASLSVLGGEFGVSKERVRQLEARMKLRLKAFLENAFGDEIEFEFDMPDEEA
jgi:DNA-directed RNA polymerase sigma subunit (sigma70/sigma32)